MAKTLLVRTLSAALDLDTKRVQFTPDLMPGDVTGSLVYDARTAEFSFRKGPVFTNFILADLCIALSLPLCPLYFPRT